MSSLALVTWLGLINWLVLLRLVERVGNKNQYTNHLNLPLVTKSVSTEELRIPDIAEVPAPDQVRKSSVWHWPRIYAHTESYRRHSLEPPAEQNVKQEVEHDTA